MTKPATNKAPDGREVRVALGGLEVRAAGEASATRTVTGYAAVFNSEADIYGCWIETIAAGAFARSLKENDVVALYHHDGARVLGRMSAKTLRIKEDAKGLAIEIDLPDTTDGRDLAVSIERKDVTGMSFGFTTRKQEWDETVEPPKRTILDVDLVEVTVTAFPAYTDTEVGLRSLEGARAERRQHNQVGALTRMAARRARQAQLERGI